MKCISPVLLTVEITLRRMWPCGTSIVAGPLGRIALAGVMVGLDTRFIAPVNLCPFFGCLPFHPRIASLQPLADFFGVLVVGVAARPPGGVAPAFEVFAHRPHRHAD